MPKDKRLYMTIPIDFLDHPKIVILSDNAIRTFIAMNGYSRQHNLDGRIPVVVARGRWKSKSLTELQSNHADRPTLTVDGEDYLIRDYSEHQETSFSIEERRIKNTSNGQKGGRPNRVANRVGYLSVSDSVTKLNPLETQSKAELEIELEIEKNKRKEASGLKGSGNPSDSFFSNGISERSAKVAVDGEFEKAYLAWPKKTEKMKSLAKFRTLAKTMDVSVLVADIIRFGNSYARSTETKFVPALVVWLNGSRWTDDLPDGQSKPMYGVMHQAAPEGKRWAVDALDAF